MLFRSTWFNGSSGDVGIITLTNTGQVANLFYASANTDVRPFTSYAFLSDIQMNEWMCRGGATTGYLCGRIHDLDVSRDVDGKAINHQNEVDFDASPGDSGAPYFYTNEFDGIHSDSTDDGAPPPRYAWYTPYVWAATVVSTVDICLDANC